MNTEELLERILAEGRRRAEEVEVFCGEGIGISAEIKQAIIGVAEESRIRGLSIRTIDHGRIGVSGTGDPAKWQACLDAALASGRIADPQEWHGLPGPAEIDRKPLSADPALAVDAESAAGLIRQLLEGASAYPVEVTGGSAGLSRSVITIANTKGAYYSMERTHAGVSLETISGQSTGYEFASSPFLEDIDAGRVGEQAAFFAAHSVGGRDIESGAYDVILSPIAAAQLIGTVFLQGLSGKNVKAGRSYLAGKLGEQCTDERLSLYDDPFARGIGSTAWDAEAVPTRRLDFVREGVLQCFAYDLRTAYRYGEQTTASAVRSGGGAPGIGVHNLIVDGPASEIRDERAVYIHDVVGAHTANPLSGDFSVEVSNPFWIEGGEFGEAIRSAMYAGNVFEMLGEIGGLGNDPRIVGRLILPSIRLNNQQIIGK
ncbi:MAG: TldD/PmbA family protein [Methanomicrobiaceae archaeon]|uniref:Tlde protein, part of tlde/tldd proteolytic complex n=1 Tax=hydrocarbon metagenome TaxID=938273 RepID=A0A0W8FH44_9ZZZZ|nr:TldD/PmbA family protein [Methanomicrobiaceae archaeon]MDD5418327.1 metallopeptidase TldD-related protein [Methanomicrobiaceae archaeon]